MSPNLSTPTRGPTPAWRGGLRRVAVVALLGIAATAAGTQLVREIEAAKRGPAFPIDYGARFEGVRIPAEGPDVQVFPEAEIAFVGYLTYAEAFTRYQDAIVDPELVRRAHRGAVHYNLTQQALAPRILVLPTRPFYPRMKLVLGNYERVEDVPDLAGAGLAKIADLDNGIVLWKRQ